MLIIDIQINDITTSYFNVTSTNGFLSNAVSMPTGYHITGWKTGTTEKAGSCIILEFVKDETEEEYICLVSNALDHETLYKNVEIRCRIMIIIMQTMWIYKM